MNRRGQGWLRTVSGIDPVMDQAHGFRYHPNEILKIHATNGGHATCLQTGASPHGDGRERQGAIHGTANP